MKTHPLVSIITINYNESSVTMDMLESLKGLAYKNIEVLVVDNASPNDNPDIIKETFPEINLIKSKENLVDRCAQWRDQRSGCRFNLNLNSPP